MKKTKLFYFALLMTMWVILTWTFNPYQLLLGAASCLLVVVFTHGLVPDSIRPFFSARALPVVLWFAVLLVIDMIKTNVVIAGRLLRPVPGSEMAEATFKTTLKNPLSLTLLANALTLIYDSAVVSVDSHSGELLVIYAVLPNTDGETLIREGIARYQVLLGKLS